MIKNKLKGDFTEGFRAKSIARQISQIKLSFKKCYMCDDYINNEDILFTSHCSHTFCQDCIKNYFSDKLKEKKIEFFGKPYKFLKEFLMEKDNNKDNISTKMDYENKIDKNNIIYFEENPFYCPFFQCEDKYNFNDINLLMDSNFINDFNNERDNILQNLDLIEKNDKEISIKNQINKKSTFGSSKTSDKKIEESKYIPDLMDYKLFGRKHMFKVDDNNLNPNNKFDEESLYNKLHKDKSLFCINCNMPALIKKPKHKHFQCLNCWKHICKYCNKILTPDHFMINSFENYCRVYFRDRLIQSNEEERKLAKNMTCIKILINFFLVIFSLFFSLYGFVSILIKAFSTIINVQSNHISKNIIFKKIKKLNDNKVVMFQGNLYKKKDLDLTLRQHCFYYNLKEMIFMFLKSVIFILVFCFIWPCLLFVPMLIILCL